MTVPLLLFAFGAMAAAADAGEEKVLLRSIELLTFRQNSTTTTRRTPPAPQLQCTGRDLCDHAPHLVLCSNVGYDGTVRWNCVGDFAHDVEFAHYAIQCEGYEHPGDMFVLRDSCALTFRLRNAGSVGQVFHEPGALFVGAIIGAIVCAFVYAIYLFLRVAYGSWRQCSKKTPTVGDGAPAPYHHHSKQQPVGAQAAQPRWSWWFVNPSGFVSDLK